MINIFIGYDSKEKGNVLSHIIQNSTKAVAITYCIE